MRYTSRSEFAPDTSHLQQQEVLPKYLVRQQSKGQCMVPDPVDPGQKIIQVVRNNGERVTVGEQFSIYFQLV